MILKFSRILYLLDLQTICVYFVHKIIPVTKLTDLLCHCAAR